MLKPDIFVIQKIATNRVKIDRAKLILCDRALKDTAPHKAYPEGNRCANHNSLLLALNCNSSYISLEHNDPYNLSLAVQCASASSIFICPQVKKQLNQYVYQSLLEQRQAVAKLAEVDRHILALVAQGHTHNTIGKIVNYSALNVGYRLKVIVQTLNLQTKQEAIAPWFFVPVLTSDPQPAKQASKTCSCGTKFRELPCSKSCVSMTMAHSCRSPKGAPSAVATTEGTSATRCLALGSASVDQP